MKKILLIIMLINLFSIKTSANAPNQKIIFSQEVETSKNIVVKIKDFKDNYNLVSAQFLVDIKDYTVDTVVINEQDLTISFYTELQKAGIPYNIKLTLEVQALKYGILKNEMSFTVDNNTTDTIIELENVKPTPMPIDTPKPVNTPTAPPKEIEAYKWTYKCPNLCESFVEAGTKDIQNMLISIFVIGAVLVYLKAKKE